MIYIQFCTTSKGDLPQYFYIFRKPETLGTDIKNIACSRLGIMLHLDIQKGKEDMKISEFQKYLGGTAACTKRLIMDAKGGYQLTSNETYFSDIWFSSVKEDEEAMAAGVDYCGLAKKIHKGFCIATLENETKNFPGGSYLVMKSTPRVTGGIPLLTIGYKYNSRRVLRFITTEEDGSTETGDPYLSCFPETYYNDSVRCVVCPHLIGRYFSACNAIKNQNRMQNSDLALEKYWVTQSGYFRLETTVALGMGIADGNLLYYHGVAEGNMDKKISTLEYNNRRVYECFNNPFTDEFGIPYLNLPPINFDDRTLSHKIAHYTPDLLPYAISVASENASITLTTTSDSPYILPSDDPITLHVMKKYVPLLCGAKIGYCCSKHDKNMSQK